MNKVLLLLSLLFPVVVSSTPKDSLLSNHNQKILAPAQKTLQTSSVVITGDARVSIGYGCLVSQDGHLITKASLVKPLPEIYVRLNKKEYKAVLQEISEEWDIALLKIDISTPQTKLEFDTGIPDYGDIVISNGVTSLLTRRLKFGVISAKSRPIPMQEARLDFHTEPSKKQSYIITGLKPGGDAEKAGLKAGDQILTLDRTPITDSSKAFHAHLIGKWPGDTITLGIQRNKKELEFDLKLMWLQDIDPSPQDRNESMSGRISTRRTGFPMIIQHDIPLSARTVGGPLLNLDGKCIGMNIARYSRAETFAIPAASILKLLHDWGVPQ